MKSLGDDDLRAIIEREYRECRYELGWRLLYCPSSVRTTASVATLGLNPGGGRDRALHWADDRQLSSEGGNAYFAERWGTAGGLSPLQVQVARFVDVLGVAPDSILSSNLVPFRSPSWGELAGQGRALDFGISLLDWVFASDNLQLVVMFGLGSAEKAVVQRLGCNPLSVEPTGWGQINARFYQAEGLTVVGLPHLSRFRIFGRAGSARLEARIAKTLR